MSTTESTVPVPQASSDWGEQQEFVERRIEKLYASEQRHERLFIERIAEVAGRDPDELAETAPRVRFGQFPAAKVGVEAVTYRVLDALNAYTNASYFAGLDAVCGDHRVHTAEIERARARLELHKILTESMFGGIRTMIDLEQRADAIAGKTYMRGLLRSRKAWDAMSSEAPEQAEQQVEAEIAA